MLIASYLLGYNDDGSVNYLGVDQAFPAAISGARFELNKSPSENSLVQPFCYDLWICFPGAEPAWVCLPELPQLVVSALLAEQVVPVVDFACGRSLPVQISIPPSRRDCA